MTAGRSIRLFLADGTPNGIITAEIMNWTGHVMVAPRSRLAELVQREESGRTGVYLLSGPDTEGGSKPIVYIGESDNVGKRLAQHNTDSKKDFWENLCVVTSKDFNLTKAHARYLEGRLITIAAEAGRSKLVNGTAPQGGSLPEADISDMEFFIDQIRIVLPVLGMEFLRDASRRPQAIAANLTAAQQSSSPVFDLTNKKHDITAHAHEIVDDFVVITGSQAKLPGSTSYNGYRPIRDELIENGTLIKDGSFLRFSRDAAFRSPSAAAAVVLDSHANGRLVWKDPITGKTYGQWQEEQVAAVSPRGEEE